MNNLVTQKHLEVAIQAADAARKITLKYFRQPLDIIQKSDDSPVTIADKEAEKCIHEILNDAFPDYGFYGEETGQKNTDNTWTWVVDPIDGTASFSTGKPTFGTLISLCYEGKPILGIIDHAALNDRWIGAQGKPTIYNGTVVTTNNEKVLLADATIYTTTPKMFTDESLVLFQAVENQCKYSIYGADCMAYGLLASGLTELVMEADLKPYDYMALVPIIEGAGGVITDWHGKEISLDTDDQILAAANTKLHQAVLTVINK